MKLPKLNFPHFQFSFRRKENKLYILDKIRRKYVHLTPEEWVRQNTIAYLTEEKNFPPSMLAIEMSLSINQLSKRADIVVFKPADKAWLLVECKAPNIDINQKTFEQIVRYNMQLNVEYFMLTNGFRHIFCKLNYQDNSYQFLKDIPDYRSSQ
jgi:hypothetical protein